MDFKTKTLLTIQRGLIGVGALGDPSFKQWFGRSKVVAADGQPLIVYRGTKSGVAVHDDSWWTGDPFVAAEYGSIVTQAYLRIENPATDSDLDDLISQYIFKTGGADLSRYDDGELLPARDQAVSVVGFRSFVMAFGFDGLLVFDDSHDGNAGISYVVFCRDQVTPITSCVTNHVQDDGLNRNLLG